MNDFHPDNAWAGFNVLRDHGAMRLIRAVCRLWLIMAARWWVQWFH
jgi:hypothetical protein